MCPMNCHPTFCGMLVEVSDGRLLGVKGDPDNPDSRGFLCIRGRAAAEIPHNGLRLTLPLVRDGRRGEDRWRAVSWGEALDRIVSAIAATRRERVGFWFGHGAHVTGINRPLMYTTMFFETVVIGMGTGAFSVLLLRLTSKKFSATRMPVTGKGWPFPTSLKLSGPVKAK